MRAALKGVGGRAALHGATGLSRAGPCVLTAGIKGVRGLKLSTGLVGIEVEPEAKPLLISLYAETQEALQAVPAGSEYRKTVEGLIKDRMAVLEATDDLDTIEEKIGGGQVSEREREELWNISYALCTAHTSTALTPLSHPLSPYRSSSSSSRRVTSSPSSLCCWRRMPLTRTMARHLRRYSSI